MKRTSHKVAENRFGSAVCKNHKRSHLSQCNTSQIACKLLVDLLVRINAVIQAVKVERKPNFNALHFLVHAMLY